MAGEGHTQRAWIVDYCVHQHSAITPSKLYPIAANPKESYKKEPQVKKMDQ